MPHVAPHPAKNLSESSDWECTNCGAELKGVNNNEIASRGSHEYNCICSAGKFIATRNPPKQLTGKAAQRANQGGGQSFPGP